MSSSPCDALAERLRARVEKNELVDVKFFLGNPSEAAVESVCNEVTRLYEALDKGEFRKVDTFKDSYREGAHR